MVAPLLGAAVHVRLACWLPAVATTLVGAPGAVQLTVAWALPAVAVTAVGAPGVVMGMTAAEAAEVTPVPSALVAMTVNVYAVPLVNPVTVAVAAAGLPVTVALAPPGEAVATYLVMVEPPLGAAVQLTVT